MRAPAQAAHAMLQAMQLIKLAMGQRGSNPCDGAG